MWKQIYSQQKNCHDRLPVEATAVPGSLTKLYQDKRETFEKLQNAVER